jgi:hypothetical protein
MVACWLEHIINIIIIIIIIIIISARVLRQASWWPAGILVLYVTSRLWEAKIHSL